jgi:hypothetical protein
VSAVHDTEPRIVRQLEAHRLDRVLAVSSIAFSLAFACAAPFVAPATLAAIIVPIILPADPSFENWLRRTNQKFPQSRSCRRRSGAFSSAWAGRAMRREPP